MKFDYTENLFSYGTLRYENVQLATFGRKLAGQPDNLPGYFLEKLKITDSEVIAKSGEDTHSIIQHGREAFLQAMVENILTTTVKDHAKCASTLTLLMNGFYSF